MRCLSLPRLHSIIRANPRSDAPAIKKKDEKKNSAKAKLLLQPARRALVLLLPLLFFSPSEQRMITGRDARGGENSILISSAGGIRGGQNSEEGVQANSIKCTRRSGPQPRRVEESSRIRIIRAVSPSAHVMRPTWSVAPPHPSFFFLRRRNSEPDTPLRAKSSPPCTGAPQLSLKQPGSVRIFLTLMKSN